MLNYHIIPVTAYQQNCSILYAHNSHTNSTDAAVVDPGGDLALIEDYVASHQLNVTQIILTHGHIDHVGHCNELSALFNCPVFGPHEDDRFLLEDLDGFAKLTGLSHSGNITPTRYLTEGEQLQIGDATIDILHCPGHTPGHLVLHQADTQLLVTGDVLFKHSIGRTDFPRGNHQDLLNSIHNKLLGLPRDTQFIPGHGPMSSIGDEMSNNPFLQPSIP